MKSRFLAVPCILIFAAIVSSAAGEEEGRPNADLAARVLEMTGGRTKIVWQHQVTGVSKEGDYMFGENVHKAKQELMGFDTADGLMRRILPGPASYAHPTFTQDGSRVVFTDAPNQKIYVVDWDGRNKRYLRNGFASCTWVDPKTGIHWVYAGSGGGYSTRVIRFQLDNPKISELVWDTAPQTFGIRVSADGTTGGGEFSWPRAGVANLLNGTWRQYGTGCNTGFAPDNSYRLFHMGRGDPVSHYGVLMYDAGGVNRRRIWFNVEADQLRQTSGIPRWTTDVRFLTVSWPESGPRQKDQDIYLGEFDEDFTFVRHWLRITNRPGIDSFAHAWIGQGLGRYTGQVPFTIELPALYAEEEWEWDFGDGRKEKLRGGKHIYTKPGRYRIIGKRGEQIVRGSVNARQARPPSVTDVRLYDEAHLAVTFDESIQLKDPQISLASATPVKGWKLASVGSVLTIELDGKVAANDSVRLEGVFGRAQVPSALDDNVVPILRPSWPADRSELVFLWETAKGQSFQYDANFSTFANADIVPTRNARYGRFGGMVLAGGVVFAADAGRGVQERCTEANQFAIEAMIKPANVYQGWEGNPRSIISCGWGGRPGQVNFMLGQERGKLVLYLRQRPAEKGAGESVERLELCPIMTHAPSHVVVSYEPGKLVCYLNGRAVMQTDKVKGALTWRRPPYDKGLNFGGVEEERAEFIGWSVHGAPKPILPWRGELEGVAIYARAATARQAADSFTAYRHTLEARPYIPRVELRGKLAAKSKVPSLEDIAPYRDALVVYEYDVGKVVRGSYSKKKIRVARWGLLDGEPTSVTLAKAGDPAELVVEGFADHPELEAEVRSNTLTENLDLRLYIDAANGPIGEPQLASIRLKPHEIWMPPGEKMQYAAETLDQYHTPIDVPIKWSVIPGGRINTGAYYGGGNYLDHRTEKGGGTIDDNGLFTGDGPLGLVTISAGSPEYPSVKGTASVALDDYPSISPADGLPMHFGGDQGGGQPMLGDIDRIRIYNTVLDADRLAAHAEAKELTNKGLIGDWTFDELKDGVFSNTAGDGLDGKIVGDVEHVVEGDNGYIRMSGKKGYVKVEDDPRLNMSNTCTLEAWVRPKKGRGLASSEGIIIDRSRGGAPCGFRFDVNSGLSSKGMHGRDVAWLRAGYRYPTDSWTHVAAVYDVNGMRKLYVNGKLVGELKRRVQIIVR